MTSSQVTTTLSLESLIGYIRLGRGAYGMGSTSDSGKTARNADYFARFVHSKACNKKQGTLCVRTVEAVKKFILAQATAPELETLVSSNDECGLSSCVHALLTLPDASVDSLYTTRLDYVIFDNDPSAYMAETVTRVIRMFYPESLTLSPSQLGPADIVYALAWTNAINRGRKEQKGIVGFTTTKIMRAEAFALVLRDIYNRPGRIKVEAPRLPALSSNLTRGSNERTWLKDTIVYLTAISADSKRSAEAVVFLIRATDPADNNVAFRPLRHHRIHKSNVYYRLCLFVFEKEQHAAIGAAKMVLDVLDDTRVGEALNTTIKNIPGFFNYNLTPYSTALTAQSSEFSSIVDTKRMLDFTNANFVHPPDTSPAKVAWAFSSTDALEVCLYRQAKCAAEIYRPIMSEMHDSKQFLPAFVSDHDIVTLFVIVASVDETPTSRYPTVQILVADKNTYMTTLFRTNDGSISVAPYRLGNVDRPFPAFSTTLLCINVDVFGRFNDDEGYAFHSHETGAAALNVVARSNGTTFTILTEQAIYNVYAVGAAQVLQQRYNVAANTLEPLSRDKGTYFTRLSTDEPTSTLLTVPSFDVLERTIVSHAGRIRLGSRKFVVDSLAAFSVQLLAQPLVDGYIFVGNWTNNDENLATIVRAIGAASAVLHNVTVQTLAKLVRIERSF